MKKEVSAKQKIVYNSMSNGLYQIISLICGLILPRFILLAYGSAYNGLVASISQFLGITEILTMGLGGAARAELYDSLAYQDNNRTSGIVKAVSLYMRKTALIFFVYMAVLMFIYPLFVQSAFSFWEISSLFLIIGLGNIINYVCGYSYSVLLDADNRAYYYTNVKILLMITNTIVSILLIGFGYSIQLVKLVNIITYALGPLYLFFLVPRHYKLKKSIPKETSLRRKQKDAAANSIALIIHENTDAVLLTILTSAEMVSVYSVYNLVIKGLKGVLSVFTGSMEPYFGNLWAKHEVKSMEITLRHYEYFIGTFVSVMLSAAMVMILPFVELYTQGVKDITYVLPVYALFVVMAEVTRCIRIPYLTVVQAAGKYKETKSGAYMEAGINIVLSFFLTLKLGIVGVAIGTLAANLFRTFQYADYISRFLIKRRIRRTVYLLGWVLFNLMINTLLYNQLIRYLGLEISSWGRWIVGGILIVGISTAEVFLSSFVFYRQDIRWIFRYIGKVFGRKP